MKVCQGNFRNDFGEGHEVWTVRDMGWLGEKNGELLNLMTAYDNTRETLRLLIPKIFERLAEGVILNVIEIA